MESPRRLQKHLLANHISFDERRRVLDVPVNVALGREMNNAVDALATVLVDFSWVGYITLFEAVTGIACHIGQVASVAGVTETIEVDDLNIRIGSKQMANEIAADEAAASSNENLRNFSITPRKSRNLKNGLFTNRAGRFGLRQAVVISLPVFPGLIEKLRIFFISYSHNVGVACITTPQPTRAINSSRKPEPAPGTKTRRVLV